MIKVDVIIPTYNRSECRQAAITSVLNQSHRDLTLLLVDDASEDDTQAEVKRFDDRRIKYIHHPKNNGEAVARNTGLSQCNAGLVPFLNDDDDK